MSMRKSEIFLNSAVQVAGRLQKLQENIVAVKFHPDAVSVLQLQPTTESWELDRIVSWSLGKDVGRAPVQENFDYLVGQVAETRKEAGILGVDAGISIPAAQFDTRLLTIPYITEEELAEESGFEGFWEDQDPDLVDLEDKIIRYQILSASENDNETVLLFSSIPQATVKLYTDLLVAADLMPVYVENEAFSLINGIYSRLPPDKAGQPQMILHICPGSNSVVGFRKGSIQTQAVAISDFDEALLLELEEIEEPTGEFWDEVGIRIGEHIKQAIAYLEEEAGFPTVNGIWLASEHKNILNLEKLLDGRLGKIGLKTINMMEDITIPPDHMRYVDYFNNGSVFTSSLGLALQGMSLAGQDRDQSHKCLLDLNFLPRVDNIRRNRQFAAVNNLLVASISLILVLSALVLGSTSLHTLMSASAKLREYENLVGEARTEDIRLEGLKKRLNKMKAGQQKIDSFINADGHTVFFSSIAGLLPKNAELESLRISRDGQAVLQGLALNSSVINTFAAELVKSGLVTQAPVDQQKTGGYYRFTINAKLRQGG